ncbi:MAG TPA: extracellular solute-binding protein [Clostridiales bacterium]|nr:extracellular solute-binding protein [Clostridiales bacterium]
MKKRLAALLLCITMAAGLLAGCGKGNTGSQDTGGSGSVDAEGKKQGGELTAMCVGTESDTYLPAYKAIVDEFNKTNEYGVTVNMGFYENEQYKTKLTTLMASNAVPDIFFTWELAYLEPFVSGGKVTDITSYLEGDQEWKNSFSGGTLDLLSYDDKIYAIPTQKSLCVMFYNKKIFKDNNIAVPTTYEDFLKACDTLKTAGVIPMAMCGTDAWIPAQFVQQISNGIAGMDLYNGISEGTRKWNDAAHVEAAGELQKMVDAGYFQNGYIGMSPEESTALFTSGKAAMYFMGAWDSSKVSEALKEDGGAFILPAKNPEYNNVSVGSVDTCFAVSANCKNKDAAVAFLKFWTSQVNEEKLLYDQGRMPAGNFEIDSSKLNSLFAEVVNLSKQQKGLTPWWDRAFGAGEGVEFNNTCVAVCGGEEPQKAFDSLQQFAEDNADR